MTPAHIAESEGRSVLDRLGVAEDPMTGADPVSFLRSLAAAGAALVKNPAGAAAANARLAIGLAAAVRATAERAVGGESPGPMSSAAGDKRLHRAPFGVVAATTVVETERAVEGGDDVWVIGRRDLRPVHTRAATGNIGTGVECRGQPCHVEVRDAGDEARVHRVRA